MRSSLALAVAALVSLSSVSAKQPKQNDAAANNPDDPTGKTLYVTEPACGFYRCTVTWNIGEPVAVNWLGPPPGNVSVALASNIGGPTYTIAASVPAISQEGYCDAGFGLGVVAPGNECGRVEFVVPDGWKQMNNYTIVVSSLSDASLAGYTDMITIAAQNSSNSVSDIPSGTDVSLVTIPAPTSTDVGASTSWTGTIPAPTAVTGGATSSTDSAAAAASTASSKAGSGASASSTKASSSSKSSSSVSASEAAASAGSSQTSTSGAGALVTKTGMALFAVAAGAVCWL
ncbi:hypothetical protein JCM1841_006136 [Sporobolomyces salmonicolor]